MTEDQQKVDLHTIPIKHDVKVQEEIWRFEQKGIDVKIAYEAAAVTWLEIRRARGMILQSEGVADAKVEERIEKKLSKNDMDRLCNLVTLVSMNAGVMFWDRKLQEDSPIMRMQTKALEKMKSITGEIKDTDQYSRYGGHQVMDTIHEWILNYYEKGAPESDNLGEHFRSLGRPHLFLDGISIKDLRKKLKENPQSILVFVASASSGVLEAGIIAEYMKKVLHIPATVDPVFFHRGYTEGKGWHENHGVRVMNSVRPNLDHIVIPIDDQIIRSGFSAAQAREGAEDKYADLKDEGKIFMSPKMRQFSDDLRIQQGRYVPEKGCLDNRPAKIWRGIRGLLGGKKE